MDNITVGHPFLNWFASLAEINAAHIKGRDIILDDFGSRRFAIGVETEEFAGTPILGVVLEDVKAIQSISWSSAGLISGHESRDWVALSAKDIRPKNPASDDPVSIRLWIPFPVGTLEGWLQSKPKMLNIKKVKNGKNKRPVCDKSNLLRLPLSVLSKW